MKISPVMRSLIVGLGVSLLTFQMSTQPGKAEDTWDVLESLEDEEFPIAFHALFSTGYQQTDLPALSQALQDRGYGAISPDFWSAGGMFQTVAWNVIAEFEGQSGVNMPLLNDDFWAQVSAGNFFVNLGYQFKPLENLRIYPLVGIGASFVDVRFTRLARVYDFDAFLDQPGWYGQMNNTALSLNLGLGLELQGWLGTLGLRGGYVWSPIPSAWWSNSAFDTDNDDTSSARDARNALLLNGPGMAPQGPYLKLVFGF